MYTAHNNMTKNPKTDTDDSDNFERTHAEYSSSDSGGEEYVLDSEGEETVAAALSKLEVLEVPMVTALPPPPARRSYRRKEPAEDKRKKGNPGYKRSEAQIAATGKMQAARAEKNAERKVAKAKEMIARSEVIKQKVERKRNKRVTDDDVAADKLAQESTPAPAPSPPVVKKKRAPAKLRTRKAPAPPSIPVLRFV